MITKLFTDAGQYAIRFGDEGQSHKFAPAEDVEELHVVRQLTLPERAVALALAISLDSDYFSRRGGWGLPFLIATE
ncbi:scramblase-related [Zea mays]|uniref:Phospholipid scramblase n=1 Tax=Zea mays TaxID=4577 RepID=A0A1D6JDH5_MAIZE|nr:scramblase-related [Zea mays]